MKRIWTHGFACACSLLAWGTLGAVESTEPELLIVARNTELYQLEDKELVSQCTLPPKTLLRTVGCTARPDRRVPVSYREVIVIAGDYKTAGWIDCRNTYYLYTGLSSTRPWVPTDRGDTNWHFRYPPALIKRQPEYIQQAWQDIEIAVDEAKKLKDAKMLKDELPEPYFARGRLWATVGNHDAALQDYLKAASLVKETNQDLVSYAKYFLTLHTALDQWDKFPHQGYPGAEQQFSKGFSAFWGRNHALALSYFDDAVQLVPTEPVYWYYRSLAHKRLRNDARAMHDALIGAHLETIERTNGVRSHAYIDRLLERLQDPQLRPWLSAVRAGDRHGAAQRVGIP